MYLINIVVKPNPNAAEAAAQLDTHRAWFAKHFQSGAFLLLGPYLDQERAGVIVAQAESRAALDDILAEDVYYPDGADYDIREFRAGMAADTRPYQGK